MKRKIVIATLAAAAVIGTGAASAAAIADEPGQEAAHASSIQLTQANDDRDDDGDRADDRDDRGDDRDDDRGDDRDGDDVRASKAAKLSADEAIKAALKAVPGTVTEAELDEDDGAVAWEIDVLGKDGKWHNLDVDPGNGKILNQHTDDGPFSDEHGQRYVREDLKGSSVDAAEAVRKADSHASGATVTSVDLEDDHKRLGTVWEVKVLDKDGAERGLAVSLDDGKVSQLPSDDEDDDGDDRDDSRDHADDSDDDKGEHAGHDDSDDHDDDQGDKDDDNDDD